MLRGTCEIGVSGGGGDGTTIRSEPGNFYDGEALKAGFLACAK